MNNDELQKAIDDITKEATAPAAEPTAVDNEALANEIAQVTAPAAEPVVPADGATAAEVAANVAATAAASFEAPAPAPAVPETPSMPPATDNPIAPTVAAPEPALAAAEPAVEPKQEEAPAVAEEVNTDMDEIRKEALKELYPLLDKTDMTVEEKYDICIGMKDEKDAIKNALRYAKEFTDVDKKVDALLKIYRM